MEPVLDEQGPGLGDFPGQKVDFLFIKFDLTTAEICFSSFGCGMTLILAKLYHDFTLKTSLQLPPL